MSVFDYLDQEPTGAELGAATPPPRMSDLWAWARDDYFAGDSADVVCERHRLSRSQFFERAKREGWLRRDQPRAADAPIYDVEAEEAFVEAALDRAAPSAYALYRRAWARAERAILMGRRLEAAGWTRIARDLRKLAREENSGFGWKLLVAANEPAADAADSCPEGAHVTPISPAQPGAQRPPEAQWIDGVPPSEPSRTRTPACAGETSVAGPDSPDSVSSGSRPASLNRQDRRRLSKLRRGKAAQPAAALAVS